MKDYSISVNMLCIIYVYKVCIRAYMCICVYICIQGMYMCMYVYMCIYMYTRYMYICILCIEKHVNSSYPWTVGL